MKRVVIIGGGYAGIAALRELIKCNDIEITMLDKHSYHYLQPDVYDYIANKIDTADITIDLITMLTVYGDRVKFFAERVDYVDFENKKITTEHNLVFDYDYLLFAVGAKTYYPPQLPGAERCEDIKRLHKALAFKQRFENELFLKIYNEAKKCDIMHIVIIGGGLSGVEIAAEMADFSQKFFKKGLFACDYMKIYLLEGSKTLLPGMSEYIIEKTTKRLESLKVDIITGVFVERLEENEVYLADGRVIPYSFCIFTGGIEAANLTKRVDAQKNKRNQFICDRYCRLIGKEDVYAAGDCMEAVNKEGKIMPATVRIAIQTATAAARNIINQIKNRPLKEYDVRVPGVMVALGGKYAVGEIYVGSFVVRVSGIVAYYLKHLIFWLYKYPLVALSKKGYEIFHAKTSKVE